MESQLLLLYLMLKQGFNWFTLASKDSQVENALKIIITEMAYEISSICDFLFGSIRTTLPTDTVNIEFTVWMVKGIYTYRKDHTAESTIFTPWSRKLIPFPSLRHKIWAYQDGKRNESALSWNNGSMFQFSAPPMTSRNMDNKASSPVRECNRLGPLYSFCK